MLSFKKENPSMWIIYITQNETESREDRNPLTPLVKRQHCFQPRHSQAPRGPREMLDCVLVFSDLVVRN